MVSKRPPRHHHMCVCVCVCACVCECVSVCVKNGIKVPSKSNLSQPSRSNLVMIRASSNMEHHVTRQGIMKWLGDHYIEILDQWPGHSPDLIPSRTCGQSSKSGWTSRS